MTYYLYKNNVPKTLEFTKIITLERIKQNLKIWTIKLLLVRSDCHSSSHQKTNK